MGGPAKKKGRKLPKKAEEVAELTSDEVLEAVFGKQAQKALKDQAKGGEQDQKDDEPISQPTI